MVGYTSAAEANLGADCDTTTSANITEKLLNHSLKCDLSHFLSKNAFCRGVVAFR